MSKPFYLFSLLYFALPLQRISIRVTWRRRAAMALVLGLVIFEND
jgi:hypothetical protein